MIFFTNIMGYQLTLINSVDGWRVGVVQVLLLFRVIVVYLGERMDVDVCVVDVAGVRQLAQDACLWRALQEEGLLLLCLVPLYRLRQEPLLKEGQLLFHFFARIQVDTQQANQEGLLYYFQHNHLIKFDRSTQQPYMRVIHIQKYGRSPILTTCSLPTRSPGQYLIRMRYAPINPSDLNFYTGMYGIRKEGFAVMGFQGSGVIQDADDGQLIGRKVSVLANMTNGTYSEYLVSNKNELIFWPQITALSDQQLSMFSINPLSVLGLCDIVQKRNSSHILLSAAASNVNKMAVQYLSTKMINKTILGTSRSGNYDDQLRRLGYDQLFRMDQFDKLKNAFREGASNAVFLDCVGGNYAGQTFNVLPKASIMVNYGRLSKENLGSIDLAELYFKDKSIRGFWLNTYLASIGKEQLEQAKRNVVQNCNIFKQRVRKVFPMEQFIEATRQSIKDQSQGKILLQLY